MAKNIKEPKNQKEGGKTFKRLSGNTALYLCVYDENNNILLLSEDGKPMNSTQVTDTAHQSFAAESYKDLLDEVYARGLNYPY